MIGVCFYQVYVNYCLYFLFYEQKGGKVQKKQRVLRIKMLSEMRQVTTLTGIKIDHV